MLPGSESSGGQNLEPSPLEDGAKVWPGEKRQSRRKDRLSDRLADHQPLGTRVRFEFAGRAHQRKFAPTLGINLDAWECQEERGGFVEKQRESFLNRQAESWRVTCVRRRAYGKAADFGAYSRRGRERDNFL